MLNDPMEKARHFHDQAEAIEALAKGERNRHRRKIMASISELFFLLHDKFVELSEPAPGEVIKFKR